MGYERTKVQTTVNLLRPMNVSIFRFTRGSSSQLKPQERVAFQDFDPADAGSGSKYACHFARYIQAAAVNHGMDVLIEIHDDELERAAAAFAEDRHQSSELADLRDNARNERSPRAVEFRRIALLSARAAYPRRPIWPGLGNSGISTFLVGEGLIGKMT